MSRRMRERTADEGGEQVEGLFLDDYSDSCSSSQNPPSNTPLPPLSPSHDSDSNSARDERHHQGPDRAAVQQITPGQYHKILHEIAVLQRKVADLERVVSGRGSKVDR